MSPYKGADRAVEIAKEAGEDLIVAGMDENVESRDYVFKVMRKAKEYGLLLPWKSYLGKKAGTSSGCKGGSLTIPQRIYGSI